MYLHFHKPRILFNLLETNYYKTLMEYFAYLNLFKPKQKDPQVTLFFIFDLPQ